MNIETFVDGPLTLEVREDDATITVHWQGRSMARNPSEFVLPILTQATRSANHGQKQVVIDFCDVEYLNSSTITPIIRILEQAKHSRDRILVRYRSEIKWQALNFSALYLFQTSDGRVRVKGDEG